MQPPSVGVHNFVMDGQKGEDKEAPASSRSRSKALAYGVFAMGLTACGLLLQTWWPKASSNTALVGFGNRTGSLDSNRAGRLGSSGPFSDWWLPCAVNGGTCNCVGTLVFSTVLGSRVREVNADGEMQCTAEALGAPLHRDLRICWCQRGVPWQDNVRQGLAALVRRGYQPRIEIAVDEAAGPGCEDKSDGQWFGCVVMSRRWDTTVIPEVMARAAPPEEQLDMTLRKLDACHNLFPKASIRVLGVRSGQAADVVELPVREAGECSLVYKPNTGAVWTGKSGKLYCATQPGTCTTTPCDCRKSFHHKLELKTPQGRRCWACAEAGKEYTFRVNALAEQMGGQRLSWWPPYGINCPPILWIFMDWRMVVQSCPVITGLMLAFAVCLAIRRFEELSGGLLPWTRIAPLFGPPLKRGEVWRFFTYSFFHLQFLDLFHNALTLLDALDVEGTPAIVLGDGSNLKCGVGAKQNFMCYPSIGLGSFHCLCVALLSSAVGGMCSSIVSFGQVVTGASSLGFGLSGAIVALYALYAGADLDQSTSVQRSFQDWVWLRLIFVGFHIVMEWVRGVSQRDVGGLLSHTAAFVSGFSYVLYFLPPMGDGTLLPADRPYVVPCAADYTGGQFATSGVPSCVRLFSKTYEYQVPVVQKNAMILFIMVVSLTIFNVAWLQRRVKSSEAVLLAGLEVSAICCAPRKASQGGIHSNYEGKEIILWTEVLELSKLNIPQDRANWQPQIVVRCLTTDPWRTTGYLLDVADVPSVQTRALEGGEALEWNEQIFLPMKYTAGGYVQLVVYDAGPSPRVPIAVTSMKLPQVLKFTQRQRGGGAFNDQSLNLTPVTQGQSIGVGRGRLHVRFRSIDASQLAMLRNSVQADLEDKKGALQFFEHRLAELERVVEESAAGEGGAGTVGAPE